MVTVVTLIIVGASLLLLEVFLPGLIAGILGMGCLIAGVVMGYVVFGFETGNVILALTGVGLVIGTMLWVRYFPQSRVGQLLVLKRQIGNVSGDRSELVGQSGVALTDLRPSGTVDIGGRRVDVVTEGGHIGRGTSVRVVSVEGMRVVVRAS